MLDDHWEMAEVSKQRHTVVIANKVSSASADHRSLTSVCERSISAAWGRLASLIYLSTSDCTEPLSRAARRRLGSARSASIEVVSDGVARVHGKTGVDDAELGELLLLGGGGREGHAVPFLGGCVVARHSAHGAASTAVVCASRRRAAALRVSASRRIVRQHSSFFLAGP